MKSESKISQSGSQYLFDGFSVLGMPDEKRAVKYFSLNPFLPDSNNRCPLGCAYCVCHQDSQWHHNPTYYNGKHLPNSMLENLLDLILQSEEGLAGFPISLCDYADPFIPSHQARVLGIISSLMQRNATNMIYITSKYHPGVKYLDKLKKILELNNSLRLTVFVSLPPIKPGYEKVSVEKRIELLHDLSQREIPCCWYLRPLTEAWFDQDLMWRLCRELLPVVFNHVILSGLVMSDEVAKNIKNEGLVLPKWLPEESGKKQLLSPDFEAKIRGILNTVAQQLQIDLGPVMSHRLCGTNGNHAYGCLHCSKNDRYCQLFQLHHFDQTANSELNQNMKIQLVHASKPKNKK
jgi:DNA repair photolyase